MRFQRTRIDTSILSSITSLFFNLPLVYLFQFDTRLIFHPIITKRTIDEYTTGWWGIVRTSCNNPSRRILFPERALRQPPRPREETSQSVLNALKNCKLHRTGRERGFDLRPQSTFTYPKKKAIIYATTAIVTILVKEGE